MECGPDEPDELPLPVEDLHAVVAGVGHVHQVTAVVAAQPARILQLAYFTNM